MNIKLYYWYILLKKDNNYEMNVLILSFMLTKNRQSMLFNQNKNKKPHKQIIHQQQSNSLPYVKYRSASLRALSPFDHISNNLYSIKNSININNINNRLKTINKQQQTNVSRHRNKKAIKIGGLSRQVIKLSNDNIYNKISRNYASDRQLFQQSIKQATIKHKPSHETKRYRQFNGNQNNYVQMNFDYNQGNEKLYEQKKNNFKNIQQTQMELLLDRRKISQNYQTVDLWKLKCHNTKYKSNKNLKPLIHDNKSNNQEKNIQQKSSRIPAQQIDQKKMLIKFQVNVGLKLVTKTNNNLKRSPNIKNDEVQMSVPEQFHIERMSYFSKDRQWKSKMMELRQMTSKQLIEHYHVVEAELLRQKKKHEARQKQKEIQREQFMRRQKYRQIKKQRIQYSSQQQLSDEKVEGERHDQIWKIADPSGWNTQNMSDSFIEHQDDDYLERALHSQLQYEQTVGELLTQQAQLSDAYSQSQLQKHKFIL